MSKRDAAKMAEIERKLAEARDRQRRAALGPPLALSDEALAEAAAVTALDAQTAGSLWRAAAPDLLKDLLHAKTEERT